MQEGIARVSSESCIADRASLQGVRGWLIDLDGVVYRGEQVLAGAADFVERLRAQCIPFRFLTNNSSRTPAQYATRLRGMGIPAEPDDFYTSALAMAEYLSRHAAPGARVLMLGKDGLRDALQSRGFRLVHEPADAEWCVVGFTDELTYDMLKRVSLAVRAGAPFLATNPDPTLPVEDGLAPGIGAILAAITVASDVQPTVIGKPNRAIIDLALDRMGLPAAECAIVGDRLDTDILGGTRAGILTVLVLSGSTTWDDILPSDVQPDIIAPDLPALLSMWDAAHE
jgi:4-nitrophenyl phosphatase